MIKISQILVLVLCLILPILSQSPGFNRSKYTEVISILNEAVYSVTDDKQGPTEVIRVQSRLNQISQLYPETRDALASLKAVRATDHYAVFVNESTKQAFLAIRGTDPLKVADLYNDSQMWLEKTPVRSQEIGQLMNGYMTELKGQGYNVVVSGHSLGGSLALMACGDNHWVDHCEVHNPYLDDNIINYLNPSLKSIKDKVVIQETIGDFVSQHYPTLKLEALYSLFDKNSNLGTHSCLSLLQQTYQGEMFFQSLSPEQIERMKNIVAIEEKLQSYLNQFQQKFSWFFETIKQCQGNQYYSFKNLGCLACPLQSACNENFLGPYTCLHGTVPNKNGQCEYCQSGKFASFGSGQCEDCQQGSYCKNGQQSPCPPGYVTSQSNEQKCHACYEGYYQNSSGGTTCIECPVGHKCPSIGMTAPIPCPPGLFNQNLKSQVCYYCYEGYYQTESGQTACNECPVGHKCPYIDKEPIPCPPGRITWKKNEKACYYCDQGQYQTQSGQTSCKECPIGHKCPSISEEPIPCPPGRITSKTKETSCYYCDQGYYQPGEGQSQCMECPAGTYCPSQGMKEPTPCPPGSFSSSTKSIGCYSCADGYYQPQSGQSSCIPKPKSLRSTESD